MGRKPTVREAALRLLFVSPRIARSDLFTMLRIGQKLVSRESAYNAVYKMERDGLLRRTKRGEALTAKGVRAALALRRADAMEIFLQDHEED